MLMGEALLQRLKEDSAVAAIVATRIFWDVRPQSGAASALPAIVLTTITGDRPEHLGGPEDMATATVQASCFSLQKGQSRELAEAVIAALLPEAEVDDIVFWRASTTEPRDIGDQPDVGGFVFNAAPDLTIRWGRATA